MTARIILAAGALALAAFLFQPGKAQAQDKIPFPEGKGSQKALMDDWVRKKRALRDQVAQDLRRKGLLPKDGVVSFEAVVKPDPKNPGKVLVHIESLTIHEARSPVNTATDAIFAPRKGGAEAASIPVGGGTVRENITIVGGKPQEPAKP
ncbi:hypothetical protein NNJEOMEG_01527 [Fundidesulfovibrio magnetotacticus]|uniref:Uncharacterized protein n=1 Tax=Fundidesulfovibrio magnetotacticus TaxID=2730080 RepID=A0A6V8LLY2_9BACT|nr:hypothetical protein [Fundidesulfovibrio magnetotacticus]GFK93693.1 hypothetical protein NNJEOMEG_01527 [Fundidesulfovibrio magnetotacticus]